MKKTGSKESTPAPPRRRATYQERLLANALMTSTAALTPVEARLVDILGRIGLHQFFGIACVESGFSIEQHGRVPDEVVARSVDLSLMAASRIEDQLQRLRDAIEEEGEARKT